MLTSRDIGTSIGLSVGSNVKIAFLVHSEDDAATLVIGNCVCEIWFERPTLETLRDLTEDALRELRSAE